jgi:hypothetical protein
MTINRKSFSRQNFTCRIKPETRTLIDDLAAKFSDEADSHIALGTVVDRAVKALAEVHFGEGAEGGANAAEKASPSLGT